VWGESYVYNFINGGYGREWWIIYGYNFVYIFRRVDIKTVLLQFVIFTKNILGISLGERKSRQCGVGGFFAARSQSE